MFYKFLSISQVLHSFYHLKLWQQCPNQIPSHEVLTSVHQCLREKGSFNASPMEWEIQVDIQEQENILHMVDRKYAITIPPY
jgi:hypothetical protein